MKCRGIVSLLNYGRQTFEALLRPILFSSLDCLMVCSYAQTGLCRLSKRNYYFPDVNLLMFRKRLTDSSFPKTRNQNTRNAKTSRALNSKSNQRFPRSCKEDDPRSWYVAKTWARLLHQNVQPNDLKVGVTGQTIVAIRDKNHQSVKERVVRMRMVGGFLFRTERQEPGRRRE